MMRFFDNTKIDFVGKRKFSFILSVVVILAGVISLIIHGGPNYGIDFTGGLSLELDLTPVSETAERLTVADIREALEENEIYGTEIQALRGLDQRNLFLINTQEAEGIGDKILDTIRLNFPEHIDPEHFMRRMDEVGPRIGEELRGKAILAIFWALLGIVIYIWWRFEFSFGIAAVIALFHDILITIGIFSLMGKEISLAVVAALLMIVGYSLNDTIVVFDRIREDLKLYRKDSYSNVINFSINETLSRTVITSLTTFVVVLSLYIFGGTVINDFAFALLIGVIVGTYSSVFVASPLLVEHFQKRQKKLGTKSKRK